MRLLLRNNRLFLSSVRLQPREFSSSPPQRRRPEEDSRVVKVSVWWDIENCHVPAGVDPLKVAPAITQALRTNGIKGPLQINAFGDVLQLSKASQESLAYTGIHFTHSPGGKNSADRFLLLDLMSWVSENPPPAHLFLISGDGDFASILHRLRMNNYNILLATRHAPRGSLCSAATITWEWSSLVKGEDLAGRHFNHSSLSSWYGNSCKVTQENSRSSIQNSASLRNVEGNKGSLDLKGGPVPNSVVKNVRKVLTLHPKGISITNLREDLKKCLPRLDKSFYGYRTFSCFLLSIPYVELQPLGEGKFRVRLVQPFQSNGSESTKIDEKGNDTFCERSVDDYSKSFLPVTSQGVPVGEYVDAESPVLSLVEREVSQSLNESQKSSLLSEISEDMTVAQTSKIQPSLKDDEEVSEAETGSLKMSSIKLADIDIVRPEDACHEIQEKCTSSGNHSVGNDQTTVEKVGIANHGTGNFRATNENLTTKGVNDVCHSEDFLSIDDSLVDKRPAGSVETCREGPTFFSWIRSWWPFSKSTLKSGDSGDSTAQQNKLANRVEDSNLPEVDQRVQIDGHFKEPKLSEMDQNVNRSEVPELFASGSFWNELKSFVFTPKGSRLVTQSRSREDMAHKLQKHGLRILRSLSEKDNLRLVELLIAEKKWVLESPSQAFPFRLSRSAQKNSFVGPSHGTNNLKSLFLSRTSQSNLQKSVEHDVKKHNQSIPPRSTSLSNLQKSFKHDVEKHNQSIPPSRTSQSNSKKSFERDEGKHSLSATSTETGNTQRSINDILGDCQKLLSEILRRHPKGYNIKGFPGLFIDRYGYSLDVQKLGYQKLSEVLQKMPGVEIESTYIFPSLPAVSASSRESFALRTEVNNACHAHTVLNSGCEPDSAPKDDNMESPWEELGPVSVNNSNQSGPKPKFSQKVKEIHALKHRNNETFVLDYDSSESKEQDSSLLQALDMLHSGKEGETSVKMSDNVDVRGKSLIDFLNSSTESTQDTRALSKIPLGNYVEKKKCQKKNSFVAGPVSSNKDELMISGLLNDSEKADKSNMQH